METNLTRNTTKHVSQFGMIVIVMLVMFGWCSNSVYALHEQLSEYHDFRMKPNVFGRWRIVSSHSQDLLEEHHYIQMLMVAVTANVLHKTMFGVSLDFQFNGTWYDSNRWMIVYQHMDSIYSFEMNAKMNVSGKLISLMDQEFIVNSTNSVNSSMENPNYDSNTKPDEFVFLTEKCRRTLIGTELYFKVNLQQLFNLTNLDKNSTCQFVDLDSSKLRVNFFVGKFEEKLFQFPLHSSFHEGQDFIQVSSVFTLSDKLIDTKLTLQKVATISHYILGILLNVIVISLLLILTPLTIYFHNTKPRSTRHFVPYIVILHVLANSAKHIYYYINGEDYILMILYLPIIVFGIVFILFFTNSLLFFYNRKVYNQVYCDIKRKSIRDMKGLDANLAKRFSQMDFSNIGNLSHTQTVNLPSPSSILSTSESNSEHSTTSLKWSKSTKLRILVKIVIFLAALAALGVLSPVLVVADVSVFITVAQVVASTAMVFVAVFTLITLLIDMYLNRKMIFQKKGLVQYFFKNDPLYFRFEMLIQIIFSSLYIVMMTLRGFAQLETDRIDHLINERASPFFFISPFFNLPIECLALVLEIFGVGGGFVTVMTLYERIKLKRQEKEVFHAGTNIRIRFNIRMDSPIYELFGKEFTQVYIDENGFELMRQFSKHEFSIENVAFIGDVEKVYSSLYECKNGDDEKSPILRDYVRDEDLERVREILCSELYETYIADGAPLCVNVSNGSKQIFSNWIHKSKEEWTVQLFNNPVFIKEFEFIIADVIRNVNDTFGRLKLTSSYKEWNESIQLDQQVSTPTSIMPSIASDTPLDPSIINI